MNFTQRYLTKRVNYDFSKPTPAKKKTVDRYKNTSSVKFDFRSPAEKAAEKDPKSPKYKKNLVDRMVDRVLSR